MTLDSLIKVDSTKLDSNSSMMGDWVEFMIFVIFFFAIHFINLAQGWVLSVFDENSHLLNKDAINSLVQGFVLETFVFSVSLAKSIHFFLKSFIKFHVIEFGNWGPGFRVMGWHIHLSG